jgi:predicted CopG family antitoxin
MHLNKLIKFCYYILFSVKRTFGNRSFHHLIIKKKKKKKLNFHFSFDFAFRKN